MFLGFLATFLVTFMERKYDDNCDIFCYSNHMHANSMYPDGMKFEISMRFNFV